jgi:hypothetical protein
LKDKKFRTETYPTYNQDLSTVESNNDNCLYMVDDRLHITKLEDLQLVRDAVIFKKTDSRRKTEKQGRENGL